ncbi:DUF4142 domain-containing protein [Pontibacter actiniarum]|uniref:DUF305 domain-containing protein n=1 Tax=Pontibacter actiniarum TaxID=323450 RepID=A0A1X9YWR5_9BACT|nr:DUF4142 domain-containing protein [Pontibacter actiniarum]ARS37184.1 DUF305 domain-containing protein [Pontibacter actiniarum]
MKKIASTGLILSAFLFGMASCNQEQGAVEEAQQTNEQQVEDTAMEDQMTNISDFMTKAASSNMLEIQSGQLAQEKGQMQEVKDFGQMMVTEHQKASEQMKQLAQQKNIVLPDSMSQEHMDKLQNLRDKTGNEFDQAYMDLMVSSHENTVSLFEDAANNIEDQEVKSFADATLPTLRQHLDRAKQIQNNVNNNK